MSESIIRPDSRTRSEPSTLLQSLRAPSSPCPPIGTNTTTPSESRTAHSAAGSCWMRSWRDNRSPVSGGLGLPSRPLRASLLAPMEARSEKRRSSSSVASPGGRQSSKRPKLATSPPTDSRALTCCSLLVPGYPGRAISRVRDRFGDSHHASLLSRVCSLSDWSTE
jgi:hypothetical protein